MEADKKLRFFLMYSGGTKLKNVCEERPAGTRVLVKNFVEQERNAMIIHQQNLEKAKQDGWEVIPGGSYSDVMLAKPATQANVADKT